MRTYCIYGILIYLAAINIAAFFLYGKTVSYGEIARMVGCKSAQAVGQAVGANPIALLIPCHRVIAAHGQLGGYAYGQELKKRLLNIEQP